MENSELMTNKCIFHLEMFLIVALYFGLLEWILPFHFISLPCEYDKDKLYQTNLQQLSQKISSKNG